MSNTDTDYYKSDREEKMRYKRSPFYERIVNGLLSYDEASGYKWINWYKRLFK